MLLASTGAERLGRSGTPVLASLSMPSHLCNTIMRRSLESTGAPDSVLLAIIRQTPIYIGNLHRNLEVCRTQRVRAQDPRCQQRTFVAALDRIPFTGRGSIKNERWFGAECCCQFPSPGCSLPLASRLSCHPESCLSITGGVHPGLRAGPVGISWMEAAVASRTCASTMLANSLSTIS
jgi:hypothetical protein